MGSRDRKDARRDDTVAFEWDDLITIVDPLYAPMKYAKKAYDNQQAIAARPAPVIGPAKLSPFQQRKQDQAKAALAQAQQYAALINPPAANTSLVPVSTKAVVPVTASPVATQSVAVVPPYDNSDMNIQNSDSVTGDHVFYDVMGRMSVDMEESEFDELQVATVFESATPDDDEVQPAAQEDVLGAPPDLFAPPPNNDHFPLFKKQLRAFQAMAPTTDVTRVDTRETHVQFAADKAVAELDKRSLELRAALEEHLAQKEHQPESVSLRKWEEIVGMSWSWKALRNKLFGQKKKPTGAAMQPKHVDPNTITILNPYRVIANPKGLASTLFGKVSKVTVTGGKGWIAFDDINSHMYDNPTVATVYTTDGKKQVFPGLQLLQVYGGAITPTMVGEDSKLGPDSEVSFKIPEYAQGKVHCWTEGKNVCCSLCFEVDDGTTRIVTATTPLRKHAAAVLDQAKDSGVDPLEVLGALPALAAADSGRKLVRDLAGVALKLVGKKEILGMTGPVTVTTTSKENPELAAMMALQQLAQYGDKQAQDELQKIAVVAQTPEGSAILAPLLVEGRKRLTAALEARKH